MAEGGYSSDEPLNNFDVSRRWNAHHKSNLIQVSLDAMLIDCIA